MKGNDVGKEKNIQSKARQVEEIRELANKYGLKLIEKKSKRKKELIGLIQDDLPQTIQILIDSIDPGNSNHNILVYAMYSYNGIQEGLKKETIKPEDARQEEAKIFHTILDMIKSLEEDLI